ncbi:hypothetical protein EOM82_08620 [bacterium]|nr:hypothetical protein [bacterium]
MEISHEGHRERLRERCRNSGFDSLSEHEKLEYLLFAYIPRRNTNDIAHRLIDNFGSFAKVLDAREVDLMNIKGMTEIAAQYLSTLPFVVEGYRESKLDRNAKEAIHNAASAIEYFKIHIGMRTTEVMHVLCLNIKRKLVYTIKLESKNPNMVILHPANLVSEIVRHEAKYIIVGHNHPSGDVTPSREDIDFAGTLGSALSVLGIELVDNIIVGGENSLSFRNMSLFPEQLAPNNTLEKAANTFFGWGKK